MYLKVPSDLPLANLLVLGVVAAGVLVVVAGVAVVKRATARLG